MGPSSTTIWTGLFSTAGFMSEEIQYVRDAVCQKEIHCVRKRCSKSKKDTVCQKEMQYVRKRYTVSGRDAVSRKKIQCVRKRCCMSERDTLCQEEMQ